MGRCSRPRSPGAGRASGAPCGGWPAKGPAGPRPRPAGTGPTRQEERRRGRLGAGRGKEAGEASAGLKVEGVNDVQCVESLAERTNQFAKKETRKDNFNLGSTHQASQVTGKVRILLRNTGEDRELQADGGQQGWETPPPMPGPPTGKVRGSRGHRKREGPSIAHKDRSRPTRAERAVRAIEAPPGRIRKPPPKLAGGRASEGRRWRGAVDNLPDRVRIPFPPESGPGEGGGGAGDTGPRDLEAGPACSPSFASETNSRFGCAHPTISPFEADLS